MRRLIEKLTPKRLIILSVIILIVIGLFYIPAFAADTFVGTHAAGTDTTFTVTEAATYEFDLYGSQGGNKDTFTGGKGGHVRFTVPLKVGDKVQIVVGNQSGVGGGGTGTASNGGGATYIKVNDNLIGVAGGGGGATTTKNGLAGGVSTAGNNGLSLSGSNATAPNTAGGGAGYISGTSGEYHAHHKGDGTLSSGKLYASSNPGGCYVGNGHTHNAVVTCSTRQVDGDHRWGDNHVHGDSHDGVPDNCRTCKGCGAHELYYTEYGPTCPGNKTTEYSCGSPVNTWKIGCNKNNINTQAYGGSNYIDSTAITLVDKGDIRTGTGVAYIYKLVPITYDVNKPSDVSQEPTLIHDTANDILLYARVGSVIEYTPAATLQGHTMNGWYTAPTGGQLAAVGDDPSKTVTWTVPNVSALTLYAQWTPKTITVTLNYGDADIAEKTITKQYGEIWNLETPTYTGIQFNGWYTGLEGGTQISNTDKVNFDEDITLYAHWTIPTYTLTFNPNGGTCSVTSKQVTNLQLVGELPTPARAGYDFTGWYTATIGGDLITAYTTAILTSDITLYAQWELKTGWDFPYTGKVDYFTAPTDGYYKLEAWGAQGGNYGSFKGGLGGYSKEVVFLKAGDVLQVNVGGQGDTFNGGGTGTISTGGGGTDFRFGSNYTVSAGADSRILVAGGGGAATRGQNGLNGGATGSGNNGTLITGSSSTGKYTAGGGGGYYGGTIGHYHVHTGSSSSGGGCYTVSHTGTRTIEIPCGGWVSPDSWDCTECSSGVDSKCGNCGAGYHGAQNRSCWHSRTSSESYTYYTVGCGETAESIQAVGGSSYTATIVNDTSVYLTEKTAGVRTGNGYAKVTQMYAMLLDTSVPVTVNNYEVNATNLAFLDNRDTVIDEEKLPFANPNFTEFKDKQTGIEGQTAFGLLLIEKGKEYGFNEKLPVPSLKGWKFLGWYTEPQINKGQLKTDNSLVEIKDSNTVLKNPVLYAHWQEETYYIKYYKANTNLNIYNDEITNPEAVFDTTLASKSETKLFRYDAVEDCYIQTVKYDHDIKVLPNYYAKTGYYFKNWTNTADTNLAGTVGIGTGTGKQTGKTYYESEVLKQNKVGEQFLETFGNFNYITNEKEMALDPTIEPIWSYGSDTVIMYATWEPIKYQLRFNGTNNWNTAQGSYLQNVVDSTGKQSTTIRYDQIFTLNPNKFTRNAPFTITSPDGLPVTLKTGYSWIGWGFGKPTMKYSTPAWNLIAVNTEYDPDQALVDLDGVVGRDYINQQASVKNVISADGIKTIEKYISDWSNARTDSNRADKQSLKDNIIESNLHSLWRRQAQGDDTTNPPGSGGGNTPGSGTGSDGEDPNSDNFGITITFDLNGGEWLDDSNKPTTEPIVLKQELFNEYYYEFDIIGNTNTDLLNKSVIFDAYGKKSKTDPSKNYDNATGLNYTFRKSDEQGNKYRFCGWSLEKGQISADYNVTIDGITNNNFDVYDVSKNNKTIKVANDLTLYAIWEPELTLNVHLYRKLGGSTKISGSLTNANQATVKAKGIPEVMIKPGEEGRYLVTLNSLHKGTVPVTNDSGELVYLYRPIDVEVTFDSVMTGIYAANNIAIKDNLNIITSADGSEPMLETSSLNRKITGIKDSSLSRNFHVPLYLGTTIAETYGYPSFKSDGYDLNITASRYSNFHKGIETVTAEFKIKTTASSSGGGEEPEPGPGPIEPTPPTNTLDELRTKLKIKLH